MPTGQVSSPAAAPALPYPRMIKLTRLDGEPFVLNAELIRYVERRPDTFITLTTGERIIVAESMDTVVDMAVRYQQQKHWMPPREPSPSPVPSSTTPAAAGGTSIPAV